MTEPGIPPELAEQLRRSGHVVVLTGSGVSAPSGIPTFREAQTGLWARYSPEELATPEAFERDPSLVWEWYAWRRQLVAETEPNAAHYALARLATKVPQLTLVTQNVDGLHQRAGSPDAIEYHGNLLLTRCTNPDCDYRKPDDVSNAEGLCPTCGSPLRPGVVWFGEAIPETAMELSARAARECDLFISAGTSAIVWPAAGLIQLAANAMTAEVNLDATPASQSVDFALQGDASELLPALVNAAFGPAN